MVLPSAYSGARSLIPKGGHRFSGKIVLNSTRHGRNIVIGLV